MTRDYAFNRWPGRLHIRIPFASISRCRGSAGFLSSVRLLVTMIVLAQISVVSAEKISDAVVEACSACHGANGISVDDRIPNLAGQKAMYVSTQLNAFKERGRKHDMMNAIAAQLGEQDIAALAKHFSALPAKSVAISEKKSQVKPIFAQSGLSVPEHYRTTLTLYHVADDVKGKKISRYYANSVAMNAARSGVPLPEGSVIVAEHSRAKLADDGTPLFDENKRLIVDRVTGLSTMQRELGWGDSVPALLRNENWRYALLTPDRRERTGRNYAECFVCHLPLRGANFVFTNAELYAYGAATK
jgi:cytochrome c553